MAFSTLEKILLSIQLAPTLNGVLQTNKHSITAFQLLIQSLLKQVPEEGMSIVIRMVKDFMFLLITTMALL